MRLEDPPEVLRLEKVVSSRLRLEQQAHLARGILHAMRGEVEAERRLEQPVARRGYTSLFRRLVPGWIEADFRVQIRILQHYFFLPASGKACCLVKGKHDQKAPEDVADWKWETRALGNPHAPTRGYRVRLVA